MTGGARRRFLDYAALARSKPSFDLEERDWKLELAARLQTVATSSKQGDDWPTRLVEPLIRHRPPYIMPGRTRAWLRQWASSDPRSARLALSPFSDSSLDPIERFERFATVAEQLEHGGDAWTDRVRASAILVIGAALNFACEPESLPLLRPISFQRLAEATGETIDAGDWSPVGQYAGMLEFAQRIRGELEQAGVPVRDMIDVQSVIDVCSNEARVWAIDPPANWLERAYRKPPADGAYLAACAVFHNEARYLREWLEFHRIVGVERFFLYNNASTDDSLDVLAPYLAEQVVVLHDWPTPAPDQRQVFDDCLRLHRDDARWIAFIDVDEFLFSPTGEMLDVLLPEYERWPGVCVQWAMFSVTRRNKRARDLVIDSFSMRDILDQGLVKSIVDPQRAVRCLNAHWFEYEYGLPVDENAWPLASPATKATSLSRLRLNHYASRSEREAREKIARQTGWGHLGRWRKRDLSGELELVQDEAIAPWIPPLRETLEGSGVRR
jgi:Glycosyltransferase family 92